MGQHWRKGSLGQTQGTCPPPHTRRYHDPDCWALNHTFGFPGPKVILKVKLAEVFQAKASQDSSFLGMLQKVVLRKGMGCWVLL